MVQPLCQAKYYLTPFRMLRDFPEIGVVYAFAFWARMWSHYDVLRWQHGVPHPGPFSYPDWVWARIPPGASPHRRFGSRAEIRRCFPWVTWERSLWYWRRAHTYGRVVQHLHLNDRIARFAYAAASGSPAPPHVVADRTPIYNEAVDRWGWLGHLLTHGLVAVALAVVALGWSSSVPPSRPPGWSARPCCGPAASRSW